MKRQLVIFKGASLMHNEYDNEKLGGKRSERGMPDM